MIKFTLILLTSFFILGVLPAYGGSSNPHLSVSAENPLFDNQFAGSMVVEVVIQDPLISDTDEGKGEPNVSINGAELRMVQATDGAWYAYFANKEKAQIADGISFNGGSGTAGQGLDFGEFCDADTTDAVLGTSFSDTEGIAIPRTGLTDSTNGEAPFSECSGNFTSTLINNVVRNPKTINQNVPEPGQIGLNPLAWPVIQLFSFTDEVEIHYNRAGNTEKVSLDYDEIENISIDLDRDNYPNGAEVILILNDVQLNQDPTDEDSWTFNINSSEATFYQAYDEKGRPAATGTSGLINLFPHLSQLGFEDNGFMELDLSNVIELKTNDKQPDLFVGDGSTKYTQIVTLVESSPSTGIFESYDESNESVIGIRDDAPRGTAGIIDYNDKDQSILAGSFSATIDLDLGTKALSGTRSQVTLQDPDQNLDSKTDEDLDVFRSSAIIPSMQIGTPITLEKASSVQFYSTAEDDLSLPGMGADSTVPDKNSDRLIIDTTSGFPPNSDFEMISIDLGITVNDFENLLIDPTIPTNRGSNWLNFDLRSIEQQLQLNDFSETQIDLTFGLLDGPSVTIVDSGDISNPEGLIKIDDDDISEILDESGNVFAVLIFDPLNSGIQGTIDDEQDTQPIVFDFFSFGLEGTDDINNAIYRLELEETSVNSSIFEGTMEYTVINQVNINDPSLITSLRTINDQIKFLVTDRLIDEEGVTISYSDLAEVGAVIPTASKTDIRTHSGTVGFTSESYRFGQPVIVRLIDSDLNLDSDQRDIYQVINDPFSPNVDTVGDKGGTILLEIKIKDIRYKRCTIDGVEHGGLGGTGFTIIETTPNSGIFEGSFKMPTNICNEDGSELISPAGGKVTAKYFDFRDEFGEPNTFETGRTNLRDKIIVPDSTDRESDDNKTPQIEEPTKSDKKSEDLEEISQTDLKTDSPKQQQMMGTLPQDVICKETFEKIFKPNGSAVCVSSETAQKLIERGWIENV